jgi:hypothetical protein
MDPEYPLNIPQQTRQFYIAWLISFFVVELSQMMLAKISEANTERILVIYHDTLMTQHVTTHSFSSVQAVLQLAPRLDELTSLIYQ